MDRPAASDSLATDPGSATTPLRNMGDGWQAVIRLAALEALAKYPSLPKVGWFFFSRSRRPTCTHTCVESSEKCWQTLPLKDGQLSTARTRRNWYHSTQNRLLRGLSGPRAMSRRGLSTRTGLIPTPNYSPSSTNEARTISFSARQRSSAKGKRTASRLDWHSIRQKLIAMRSVSITQCGSVSAIPALWKSPRSSG